ncbi:MAG: pitrilysin family protein [Polyangia bacterium]
MTEVLVEENHDLPIVRLTAALRTGGADDVPELDGLASFATELMARGAAGRSRMAIDEALDALGAQLTIHTHHDGAQIEITALRDRLDESMALLCDLLLRPDFPVDEADKLRREQLAHLDELREEDSLVAGRFLSSRLFGEHPYGRTLTGTEATLPRLTAEAGRAWHDRAVRAPGVLFAFAGDLDTDAARRLVATYAADLRESDASYSTPYAAPTVRTGTRITLVDKPERTQSQILLGHVAPDWRDPGFDGLLVATHVLGGTFTSRLMDEVRAKRGLSYGAGARLGQGRGAKAFVINVFPSLEQTAETLALVRQLYNDFCKRGITRDELEFARANLRESFAFNLATPEDRLDVRLTSELAGFPPDHLARFPERVAAVSLEVINEALQRLMRPDDLEIVIVTTADELRPALEAAGLLEDATVEVVPYDHD